MTIEISNQPQAFAAFERHGWETQGLGYDRHFSSITTQSVAAMLDVAHVGAATRVLDLCTGPGMLAGGAVARGANVVGVDISETLIGLARSRYPDAEFQVADAQDLPFEDSVFDAVLCGFGLMHLPNPGLALAQMRRVLKPAGRLAVSVWAAAQPGNGFGALYCAIDKAGGLAVDLPHGPDFFQFSNPDVMIQALTVCNFDDVAIIHADQTVRLGNASQLLDIFEQGTVRASALIRSGDLKMRDSLEREIHNWASGTGTILTGFDIAMPAIIGSARKPD